VKIDHASFTLDHRIMKPANTKLNILGDKSSANSARTGATSNQIGKLAFEVEVVSDVICPWCWIGKRRLEKAIKLLGPEAQVKVTWRPFQLNPTMPREGADRSQYIRAKFGSLERFAAMEERLVEIGAEEGIDFKFGNITRIPNTLDAHRLIRLAQRHAKQDVVVESLFQAYFVDGVDVGDRRQLLGLADAAGIDPALAENFLASEEGLNEVISEERQFKRMGIDGVPGFVVNGDYLFSGAAEPQVMVDGFRQAVLSAS
jgi:predicted DsbA family dithiol-disulfide isomerase